MSKPNPTEPPPPDQLPSAWQPLTLRGVAAFSQAKRGRLALAQTLAAVLTAAAVCGFLAAAWFPAVHASFAGLPEEGAIRNGTLAVDQPANPVLFQNRFLALIVNPGAAALPPPSSDLRVEFGPTAVSFHAGRGGLAQDYPPGRTLPFNQTELQAAWEAWVPMLFGLAGTGTIVVLLLNWVALATLYSPVPWLIAFFKDRQLNALGAWKLAAAALLPGALLATAGLVLYTLALIDLPQFTLAWALHFPLAWIYLVGAPFRLPRLSEATPRRRNPFRPAPADEGGDDTAKSGKQAKRRDRSPFAKSNPAPR